jgi:hypothetical protein
MRGKSDIFWLRSILRPLIKNDIAYLVSPKISATYSAKLMIFSFIGIVNLTSPNLSEAMTNLILTGTVKQQSFSSIISFGIDTFFNYKTYDSTLFYKRPLLVLSLINPSNI